MAVQQVGVTEDTKKDWDAGLNQGIVFRHAEQKKPTDPSKPGYYDGPARPEYYAESAKPIRFAKAIALAFVAVVPYFTVLDQLGHNVDFRPCNNVSCHYMRLFNSKHIPATGASVISVRNGIERPLALHYFTFDAYSCPLLEKQREFGVKVWGEEAAACPKLDHYKSFLDTARDVKPAVKKETDYAVDFTPSLKFAFYITKLPLWLFSYPMNLMAKTNKNWGMEHVPSAICKGKTYEEHQARCVEINEENKVGKNKGLLIHNHLRTYSPAKIGVVLGLGGYALFTALHDCALLMEQSEMVSLSCGFAATVLYGVAGVSMFFWAMGAAEVFVAAAGDSVEDCACYYSIPEMSALVGLSTPFAVFVGFLGRVQMQGLAALFGDFLAYQTYYIPHYLGKQSYLWTWAALMSPKMAGTIQGEPRKVEPGWWQVWQGQQLFLWYFSLFLQLVVALSASSFMIAFKELCTSLYIEGDMTPMVNNAIKYVLLPVPSIVTAAVGVIAVYDLALTTIMVDQGETFTGQLKTIFPVVPRISGAADKVLGWVTFIIFGSLLTLWTIAVTQGLCPDKNFLMGNEGLVHPKLAQAELWGACGFIFFFAHIPRLMAIGFSTWDDLESLKWLAIGKGKYKPEYSTLLNTEAGRG